MNIDNHIIHFFLKIGLPNLGMLVLSEIRRRMDSDEVHFGLYFDLEQEILIEEAPFPLDIRPIIPEDIPRLFYAVTTDLTSAEIRERLERLFFLKAGVPACFVASGPDKFPYALCWLIGSEDNKGLEHYFKGNLPLLKPDEVLLEFVFVHPDYRGKRLMEWISKKLFVQARSKGARCAVAYVRGGNKVSLVTARLFGWKPFLKKNVTWKFFKRRITYKPLTGDYPKFSESSKDG